MPTSMQVIYPISDGTHFDMDYYLNTHMPIVAEHMGPHIQNTLVTKGLGSPGGNAPGFYAVASMVFENQDAFDAAMKVAGPVMADVPNFTNVRPEVLIGEVIG